MTRSLVALALVFVVVVVACAPEAVAIRAPGQLVLRDTDGSPHPLDAELSAHRFTVVTFFSNHCACQRAHDARLRELMAKETPRDVGLLLVDSEESATATEDAAQAKERGYHILLDDAGNLARAMGADYATYSVVLDRDGGVLYRGGFDSNRSHLSDDRAQYLADALDDLAAGRPVQHPETKALGCTLELR
jgi:hypothetical protein